MRFCAHRKISLEDLTQFHDPRPAKSSKSSERFGIRPEARKTRSRGRGLRRQKPSRGIPALSAGRHGANEHGGNIHDSPHSALHTGASHAGPPSEHGQDGNDSGNVLDDPKSLDAHESSGYRSNRDRHGFDYGRSNTSSDGIDPPQAHHQEEQHWPSIGHDRTLNPQRGSGVHRRPPAMRASRHPGFATWPPMVITNTIRRNPIRQTKPDTTYPKVVEIFSSRPRKDFPEHSLS